MMALKPHQMARRVLWGLVITILMILIIASLIATVEAVGTILCTRFGMAGVGLV